MTGIRRLSNVARKEQLDTIQPTFPAWLLHPQGHDLRKLRVNHQYGYVTARALVLELALTWHW